jgi:release factor glutamine methyltransferase
VSTPPAIWTILEVLKWTTSRFAERGIPTARLDAELLAAHAFSMPRIGLYTQFDRPLQAPELASYRDLVKRRQGGEPVAYITGKKEFWSLELLVDRRVLVPRPDTETAVEVALELLRGPRRESQAETETEPQAEPDEAKPAPPASTARVVDIGTGSGAIALALKKELPAAEVLAVDVSEDALAVARANAQRLGLQVEFLHGDLTAPLAGRGPFALIVANLPYVPRGDLATLAPEVHNEPVLALDGGADGLDVVRTLVPRARDLLQPGGALVLEIGIGQALATETLLLKAGFVAVGSRRDLGDIERVVFGRTPGGA